MSGASVRAVQLTPDYIHVSVERGKCSKIVMATRGGRESRWEQISVSRVGRGVGRGWYFLWCSWLGSGSGKVIPQLESRTNAATMFKSVWKLLMSFSARVALMDIQGYVCDSKVNTRLRDGDSFQCRSHAVGLFLSLSPSFRSTSVLTIH